MSVLPPERCKDLLGFAHSIGANGLNFQVVQNRSRLPRAEHTVSPNVLLGRMFFMLRSVHRSYIACIALLGIVFSQLAVAAYVCPMLIPSGAPAQMESRSEMAGMPCAEMDAEQPLLCLHHCHQGDQTVGASVSIDFQPILPVFLVAPAMNQAEAPAMAFSQAPWLARTTSPPPLWRSGRLRI